MTTTSPDDHLLHLLELLRLEREEDLRQYRQNTEQTPLQERRERGLTWYPVQIADVGLGTGGLLQIAVTRHVPERRGSVFQTGSAVALFANTGDRKMPSVSGVITALWDDRMRISLHEEELPEWVEEGKLGIDLLFDNTTYAEMEHALQTVRKAEKGRIAQLRDVLSGKHQAGIERLRDELSLPGLNPAQQQAVRMVLAAEDVALVHGPPGTGKTTTLVQAIRLVVKEEKQVLVTAPSNAAVDLLTERLAAEGLRVLRIGNPARVSEQMQQHTLEAQIGTHPDARLLKQYLRDAEEYRRMATKYKRSFGPDERQQRKLLREEAHKLQKEAGQLEDQLVKGLLDDAQVITATLVGAAHRLLQGKTFRTVFIDEAAQALEPACWIPILRSHRVVLAGDHCQLPPTVKSQEAAKAGLATTLFERLQHAQPHTAVLLDTQYRMHQAIMGFSSEQFYEGKLKAAAEVAAWTLAADIPALEFIDTAGCGYQEEEVNESPSRANPEEAALLVRHLIALLTHPDMGTHWSVGLISPYKGQTALLAEAVRTHPELAEWKNRIQVSSVDGFQGQEKDIIYISLVRSNLESTIGFLQDTRRMNVAMTRARRRLVVIGDSATIGQHPFYEAFIHYTEKLNAYHSAWEYMA